MSARHPVIAVTGSSGAGTTSVSKTFEQIFRREQVRAAFVEGDSFHRYNRAEMKERMADAVARADHKFSHFGPEARIESRAPRERLTGQPHQQDRGDDCSRPPGKPKASLESPDHVCVLS